MQGLVLRLAAVLLHFLATRLGAAAQRYKPTDLFLLNCGASSKMTSDYDGRDWDTDKHYLKFMPANTAAISSTATAEQGPSVHQVPFITARIFTSELTYSFPVSSGQKFLRLYFYPAQYSGGFNKTGSFFSVTANHHTLLKNFSAFLTARRDEDSIKKEFIVNVDEKEQLNLTFWPSPNSYAFVNGIEIVSMPPNLYIKGDDYQIPLVGSGSFYVDDSTAMETLYRLNVGGTYVGPKDDTGMFREWSADDNYVIGQNFNTPSLNVQIHYTNETPAYTAPDIVYTSSRTMVRDPKVIYSNGLFWRFPVDAGFVYLFRLYFCEFQQEINQTNQRVFSIEINNATAEKRADVIEWTDGKSRVPIMKDYVAVCPRSKQNALLSMRPNMEGNSKPVYYNTILNGLEIFKLNDTNGSLAVPNPDRAAESPATDESQSPEKKDKRWWAIALGGGIGVLFIISGIFLIFRCRQRMTADPTSSVAKSSWVPMAMDSMTTQKTGGSGGSHLPSDLCRHFSLDELKLATDNFNANFIIGKGGFGKVYRGYIDDGTTAVAIKRLKPESRQGFREFQTEIQMLSKLRHVHLVSLIGYCADNGEMILVYDYMAGGTLRDHLYNSEKPPLPWNIRLQICIGAAKGLHYLHAGARHPIIHRDIKSTNILLDHKWVAKLSDFGLSKVGPLGGALTHVSTMVKGSIGYVDPEYYRLQQVTERSDVYSFGVVLFEVLCARPAVLPKLPKHEVSLAEYGRRSYETRTIDKIVDPNLNGQITSECLNQYTELAYNCLKDRGIDRPTMSDVVWSLEFALQLQGSTEKRCLPPSENDGGNRPKRPRFPLIIKVAAENDNGGELSMRGDDEEATKSSFTVASSSYSEMTGQSHNVFSEFSNNLGVEFSLDFNI